MRPLTRLPPLRLFSRTFFRPLRRQALLHHNVRRQIHTSRIHKEQQQLHGGGTIETINIQKPAFSSRRLLLLVAYAGGSYYIVQFMLGQLADKLGLEEEDYEAAEGGDGDEDEESLFIAFQSPQKLPRTFYKQSDPEWQEFVKMSNDETRKEAVKEELAQRVTHDISAHPRMKMRLGRDISLTRFWLELKYPDSPPPEYARQGIEVADEYVAWSTQVIPHAHYVKLQHILYPTAIFTAFLNSIRIFGRLQAIKVKDALGLSLSPLDKQVQALSRFEQSHRTLSDQKSQLDAQRDATAAERRQLERQLTDPQPSEPAKQKTSTTPPTPTATFPSSDVLPSQASLPADFVIAWKMFASTLVHNWFSSRVDQEPRGSFLVVGQVEVTGDRGKVKCDVKAAYDPKAAKYLYVKTTVKHFWELRQSAKGGP